MKDDYIMTGGIDDLDVINEVDVVCNVRLESGDELCGYNTYTKSFAL